MLISTELVAHYDTKCAKKTSIKAFLLLLLKKESSIVIYRLLFKGLNSGVSITSMIRETLGVEGGTLAEHLEQWISESSCDVILILDDIR